MKLVLPNALAAGIMDAALAAFPGECCGLIEGMREGEDFQATAFHVTRNLAAAPGCFEIDPAGRIAAQKSARARGRGIIGCYHSHPNGQPQPSPRDVSGAGELDFLWLIAATDGVHVRLAAFVYCPTGFLEITLSSAVGADLVTSSLNERR